MDYDETKISRTYDRARGYPAEILDLWIDRILAVAPTEGVDAILDLGCGTGRYSFALARAYDARVIGVDPSEPVPINVDLFTFERG